MSRPTRREDCADVRVPQRPAARPAPDRRGGRLMTRGAEETARRPAHDFEVALVHLETLRRMARRMCGNRADADDLVQETYLAAFRHFDQFSPGGNCRAWLFTILRNTFLNRLRQRGRLVLALDGREPPCGLAGLVAAVPNPEEELSRRTVADLSGRRWRGSRSHSEPRSSSPPCWSFRTGRSPRRPGRPLEPSCPGCPGPGSSSGTP